MRSGRHMVGLGASAVVHVALFAWSGAVERAAVEPAAEPFEVELVEIGVARDKPLAPQAGDEAQEESPTAPAAAARRHVRSVAKAKPAEREFEGARSVDPAPEPSVEPEQPELAVVPGASDTRPSVAAPGQGAGGSTSTRGRPGSLDHSSYGAEIVRIVKAEIDQDPVPGIRPTDTIQVLIKVLPNGDLAWTRDGRFGFANVLRSSLGRIRTRRILRRIERASSRFPAHPSNFERRHYVVDVTVNFSRRT